MFSPATLERNMRICLDGRTTAAIAEYAKGTTSLEKLVLVQSYNNFSFHPFLLSRDLCDWYIIIIIILIIMNVIEQRL